MPKMTQEDYSAVELACRIQDTEEYAVVWHKVRGRWLRSIHVFERAPMTKELTKYEDIVSKVKVKGQKVTMEGSQVAGSKFLYDVIISRVYDLPVGRRILGEAKADGSGFLTREEAAKAVPALVKREAIRDLIGEVYSDARMTEIEGDDEEEEKGDEEENPKGED